MGSQVPCRETVCRHSISAVLGRASKANTEGEGFLPSWNTAKGSHNRSKMSEQTEAETDSLWRRELPVQLRQWRRWSKGRAQIATQTERQNRSFSSGLGCGGREKQVRNWSRVQLELAK